MDAKIVYRDGSHEIFVDITNLIHSKDHNLFRVELEKNAILIPDGAVRTAGVGRLEEIRTVENGSKKKVEEVFIYE